MADVPLGKSAYRRSYGQEPEIKMVNRFFEQDPTNQVSGNALLSRAGTTLVQSVGDGPIRGLHTRSGAFNSDLFVVSADTLYRVAPDGTEIAISGTLSSTAGPWMTITTGPGFENLFISDGAALFVYEGISCSRGTLEGDSGGSVVDGDQVRIGDTYYEFTTGSVDAGTPDGSSANPWLVALGTAKASARLVFLNDGRIDIAGYAVFIGEIPDGTPAGEGGDLRFVYTMSAPDELERNNPRGTGDNPWRLATREGITARSYLSLLKAAVNATGSPGVDYSRELVQPNEFVTADEVAGGTSPADPRDNYLTVRALTGGADGNNIQVRNVQDRAPIFRWEDDAGNPVTSLVGGSDTASDVPSALQNLSRAIDATGIPGTDYSSDLTAHPDASTEFLEGPTLDIVACNGADSNGIVTTTTSTGLAWGAGTLEGGGEHRLDSVEVPDSLPAGSLNTLGGFVTVSIYEDDRFFWIRPGERIIDPLNFATAESEPDKIVESLTLADQLVLFGGSTVEFWSATGNPELPFRPSRGQTLDVGAIPNTPAKTSEGIIFVGSDGAVYATSGGPVQKVSTNGIDERVRQQLSSIASDEGMQSWTFDQDGHTFFVLHLDPEPAAPDTQTYLITGFQTSRLQLYSWPDFELLDWFQSADLPSDQLGIVFDDATGMLIVANSSTSTIYVLDGFSDTIVDQFAAPPGTIGDIAIDPSTGNLLSTDQSGNQRIYVHDGVSSTILQTLTPAGLFPVGVTVDPSTGNMVVSDLLDAKIYVYDGISETVLTSFDAPVSAPRGLAIDPDTGNLISTFSYSSTVAEPENVFVHAGVTDTILSSLETAQTPLELYGVTIARF